MSDRTDGGGLDEPSPKQTPVATKSLTLDELFENPLEQVDDLVLRAKELVSKSNPQGFVTEIEATLGVSDE